MPSRSFLLSCKAWLVQYSFLCHFSASRGYSYTKYPCNHRTSPVLLSFIIVLVLMHNHTWWVDSEGSAIFVVELSMASSTDLLDTIPFSMDRTRVIFGELPSLLHRSSGYSNQTIRKVRILYGPQNQGLGEYIASPALMRFVGMYVSFCFLAFVLKTVSSGSLRSGRGCRCPRSSNDFDRQYYKAYRVVKAYVLSNYVSCDLCSKPRDRKYAIRTYRLHTSQVFRGSYPGGVFYAQALENLSFCGVRLRTGGTYMLNLSDPRRISAASHWKKGQYVLEACQSHYNWRALSTRQQQFLYSRL